MLSLNQLTYKPLSFNETITVELTNGILTAFDEKKNKLEAKIIIDGANLIVNEITNQRTSDDLLSLIGIEFLLGHVRELKTISCTLSNNEASSLLKKLFSKNNKISFSRSEFFQIKSLWHGQKTRGHSIVNFVESNGVKHPLRDNPQTGFIYKRYVPEIQKTVTFRVIDLEKDLETFHEWHNQFRVNKFWELKGTKEEHTQYIKKQLADNHLIPTIVEFNGEPLGYFELYWTYEDRLGPYYPSAIFDRGFHFLVGNRNFLGSQNTDAVLRSMCHMLFLDDERTTKIMAEPRADNTLVLKYIETFPVWKKLYEFDFPHKRAALIEGTKERFINGDFL